MEQVLEASDHAGWRSALDRFERVDVCHMPEYHQAYSLRFEAARALMWCYDEGGEQLCYPFLLSPVILHGGGNQAEATGFYDISGIYGYSGPLATSADDDFLGEAWRRFDAWAAGQRAMCEFIRFSTYVGNHGWAHPQTRVEYNRPVSLSLLPDDAEVYLARLSGKTRNMIRKADKLGLAAREVGLSEGLAEFRTLYRLTMGRNQATEFFDYDDAYYDLLAQLPAGELLLFAVYQQQEMVAAAMCLVHGDMAFYHLGASTLEASRQGAGNLALFAMARGLIARGIGYFSVGGGRTTSMEDPLFKFKKSNGTSVGEFYIGKRVIDQAAYDAIVKRWETMNDTRLGSANLQFYR